MPEGRYSTASRPISKNEPIATRDLLLEAQQLKLNDYAIKPSTRTSYFVIVIVMALVVYLHFGTFLLTSFFGYLALQVLTIRGSKWLSVTLYLIAVAVIGAGLVYFSNLSYRTLPRIVEISIPAMAAFAEKNGIELPFTEYASLKSAALDTATEGLTVVGQYAKMASFQFVLVIAGLVVPVSIFLGSGWTANNGAPATPDNFYTAVTRELTIRFETLYASFAKVMGAQIVIAAINAGLTAAFLIFNSYPHVGRTCFASRPKAPEIAAA